MFRHGIELGVKHLCIALSILNENGNLKDDRAFTHNLPDNWKYVKDELLKLIYIETKEPIKNIDEAIRNFNFIDRKSETFRYPISNEKKPFLKRLHLQDYKHINIKILFDKMTIVRESFEYLFYVTSQLYSEKIEFDQYKEKVENEINDEMSKIYPINDVDIVNSNENI